MLYSVCTSYNVINYATERNKTQTNPNLEKIFTLKGKFVKHFVKE